MLKPKRLVLFGVIILVAVALALFFADRISAPENQEPSKSSYTDGETVSIVGEVTCLPHRNQDGPQTLECAIGLVDAEGDYYGLNDTTKDHSFIIGLPSGKKVKVDGTFRNETSEKYRQAGTIEIAATSIVE